MLIFQLRRENAVKKCLAVLVAWMTAWRMPCVPTLLAELLQQSRLGALLGALTWPARHRLGLAAVLLQESVGVNFVAFSKLLMLSKSRLSSRWRLLAKTT
jgi:hypothetical protein